MSRLIDADALIDGLKECKNNKGLIEKLVSSFVFEVVIPYVEQQPTAYDVDKVVEQLKEKVELAYKRYMDCDLYSPCFSRYRSQYYEREMCFEIVKGGVRNA